MAFPASLFGYRATAWRDVNVVLEPTRSEIVGMPETVARLGRILGDKSRWRMAVIANGHGAVTRLPPAAELVLHYMAIHTRLGIVGHVRVAAGVNERVRPHSNR